jgi:hypothetical protein
MRLQKRGRENQSKDRNDRPEENAGGRMLSREAKSASGFCAPTSLQTEEMGLREIRKVNDSMEIEWFIPPLSAGRRVGCMPNRYVTELLLQELVERFSARKAQQQSEGELSTFVAVL